MIPVFMHPRMSTVTAISGNGSIVSLIVEDVGDEPRGRNMSMAWRRAFEPSACLEQSPFHADLLLATLLDEMQLRALDVLV